MWIVKSVSKGGPKPLHDKRVRSVRGSYIVPMLHGGSCFPCLEGGGVPFISYHGWFAAGWDVVLWSAKVVAKSEHLIGRTGKDLP